MDINNDGIIEIPVSSPMLGYETFPEEERLLRTDWNDLIDGQLVKIMSSYVNGGDGYIFKFPEEWVDKVSVRKDNATGDVVFFRYSGSVTNDENVVLRIRTIKRSDLQQQGVPQGYQEVKDNGQMTYLASVSAEGNADLAIDIKDVESNLLIMT